ncbi:CrcB protein [Streptomyces calvus]|uniref:fluoride efflux transporter FluC n=1 Tax=Streptomyces calvus TaxID=67282 RepID=UPI0035168D8F
MTAPPDRIAAPAAAPSAHPGAAPQPSARRRTRAPGAASGQAPVVAAVAAGGALGAAARHAASLLWPAVGAFPWTTLVVNVLGCAVIGVFMVAVTEVWTVHRLLRPFFGTGVLGGFTTFSTYAVDVTRLLADGHARTGLVYLAVTVPAALLAAWGGAAVTRRLASRIRRTPARVRVHVEGLGGPAEAEEGTA